MEAERVAEEEVGERATAGSGVRPDAVRTVRRWMSQRLGAVA